MMNSMQLRNALLHFHDKPLGYFAAPVVAELTFRVTANNAHP